MFKLSIFRGALLAVLAAPASLLAFLTGWAAADWRWGALAGAAVFTLFFAAAVVNILRARDYSYADCLLPPLFSLAWSLVLVPLSFGERLFAAPAFIGSAVLLGACMAMVRLDGMRNRRLLWLPVVVFAYEMLPVNIPGPFDDYFSFGGAFVNSLFTAVKTRLFAGLAAAARELLRRKGAGL